MAFWKSKVCSDLYRLTFVINYEMLCGKLWNVMLIINLYSLSSAVCLSKPAVLVQNISQVIFVHTVLKLDCICLCYGLQLIHWYSTVFAHASYPHYKNINLSAVFIQCRCANWEIFAYPLWIKFGAFLHSWSNFTQSQLYTLAGDKWLTCANPFRYCCEWQKW